MKASPHFRLQILSVVFLSLGVSALAVPAANLKAPVRFFLAGDVMLGRGVAPLLKTRRTNLQKFQPSIARADVAFCNLECALDDAPRAPRSREVRLTAATSSLRFLSEAGFDLLSGANNHALDAGPQGVRRLQTALKRIAVQSVGVGLQPQARNGAWRGVVKGRPIAWLAATAWGPFQRGAAWVRPLQNSGLVEQVRRLAKEGDAVFVSLHWGQEYAAKPTLGQRRLAHALVDAGAMGIVGHHSHIAGPVEIYRGRPIFYSLGNFVFDRTPRPQSGLAALVTLRGEAVEFQTVAVSLPQSPHRAAPNLPRLPANERILGQATGHFLRGEKTSQRLIWSRLPSGVHCLRAFGLRSGRWQLVARGFHPIVEKMSVADVDGDGRDEIWLQLRQRAKLDVAVKARLFLYGVEAQRGFRPRWRGSALSRPFHEWTLWPRPQSAGCDVAALETSSAPDQRDFSWLAIYRWNGFGFRRLWDTPLRGRLRRLQSGRDRKGPFLRFEQQSAMGKRTLILRSTPQNDLAKRGEPFYAVVEKPSL